MQATQIFLVEDEAIIAQDLKHCLTRMGYEVCHISHTGTEALQTLKVLKPDVVLMDIVLRGEIDGIDTAREIQERYKIPVVYLTAYGDESTFGRAKNTDPSGYLLKPVEELELKKAIEFALYKKAFDEKRQAAEKEHQKTLSLLMAVLEATADGILVLNDQGQPVRWNQKFLQMWRVAESAFSSAGSLSLSALFELLQDSKAFSKIIESLQCADQGEEKALLLLKDGRCFEAAVKSQALGEKERCLILRFLEKTEKMEKK